jgi:hypothetical protein
MKKTNKATLARNVEKMVTSADIVPTPSACIIDGMSLVHKVNAENRTFADLSENIFMSALQTGTDSTRIDIVFDVYMDISIKTAERDNRGSDSGVLFTNIVPGHKIYQWRNLLRCSKSKTTLIKFLCDEWRKPPYLEKLGEKEMYVTCEDRCIKLTRNDAKEADELVTSQEEADTRMLLHAKHASQVYERIVIVCEDTDVLILCLALQKDIRNMYIRCGTKQRMRYIDINKLSTALGSDVCDALLGVHAFTGCDSVSAFGGRGKVAGLKIVSKDDELRKALAQLGENWILSAELFSLLQEFTCRLYASQTTIKNVNDLRYQIFRTKNGDVESSQLPPCEDSLKQHALRANYQAAIWRRSLEKDPNIPSPDAGHGWIMEDGQLDIEWMTGPPAPEVVLQLMSCKCKRQCQPDCPCVVNGFLCSPACKLQPCQNMCDDEDEADIVVDESSDSEVDEDNINDDLNDIVRC